MKMSWLWQDKKTEQLKTLLNSSFEDEKKNTSAKLSKIKEDSKVFKKHVDAAFANARVTSSMKSRKHIIDGLEEKTTDLQGKIANTRQWNVNQMSLLEQKEQNLEASLVEVEKKNEEIKAKALEKEEQIKNVKNELTCEEVHLSGDGGRNPTVVASATQIPSTTAHVGPPTSGSKAGGPQTAKQPSPPRPSVTGWSTDDERIFDREAAKINLKWARIKKQPNHQLEDQEDQQGDQSKKLPKSMNPATDWWYLSTKLKNEFVHRVWESTSGSVNTLEAVERHAWEWIKFEDAKYKKRLKVQKWREVQAKEKEDRLKKAEELKETVQECKDCEKRVKTLEKMRENNKQKLAEWKEIKVMKEELKNASNLVKTVAQMESHINKNAATPRKLTKRPKSARNMLIRPPTSPNNDENVPAHKKLIEAFQQRDQEMMQKKLMMAKLEKAKTSPNIMRLVTSSTGGPRMPPGEESTLLKPTISSMRKGHGHFPDEAPKSFEKTFELETRLLQIDHVPKLGLPTWRMPSR